MHYLIRVEVYLGAAESSAAAKGATQRAVIRYVTKALEGPSAQRLIVADNYYTSCALVLDLLQNSFYPSQ
ncbi:PiggyBac transposable element-derived protein [Phytophthora cactorum]|nr:PiggyBac transposable element-derived protein [Phytophthora cactorum]